MTIIDPDADDFAICDSGKYNVEIFVIVQIDGRHGQTGIGRVKVEDLPGLERQFKFEAIFVATRARPDLIGNGKIRLVVGIKVRDGGGSPERLCGSA